MPLLLKPLKQFEEVWPRLLVPRPLTHPSGLIENLWLPSVVLLERDKAPPYKTSRQKGTKPSRETVSSMPRDQQGQAGQGRRPQGSDGRTVRIRTPGRQMTQGGRENRQEGEGAAKTREREGRERRTGAVCIIDKKEDEKKKKRRSCVPLPLTS